MAFLKNFIRRYAFAISFLLNIPKFSFPALRPVLVKFPLFFLSPTESCWQNIAYRLTDVPPFLTAPTVALTTYDLIFFLPVPPFPPACPSTVSHFRPFDKSAYAKIPLPRPGIPAAIGKFLPCLPVGSPASSSIVGSLFNRSCICSFSNMPYMPILFKERLTFIIPVIPKKSFNFPRNHRYSVGRKISHHKISQIYQWLLTIRCSDLKQIFRICSTPVKSFYYAPNQPPHSSSTQLCPRFFVSLRVSV